MTIGIRAGREKTTWLQRMTEEQAHANHMTERILQFGDEALLSREQLLNPGHAEQIKGDLLVEMNTADLLEERSAVYNYRAMIAALGADDPTTRQVLERILVYEERRAEHVTNLLKDCGSRRQWKKNGGRVCNHGTTACEPSDTA